MNRNVEQDGALTLARNRADELQFQTVKLIEALGKDGPEKVTPHPIRAFTALMELEESLPELRDALELLVESENDRDAA